MKPQPRVLRTPPLLVVYSLDLALDTRTKARGAYVVVERGVVFCIVGELLTVTVDEMGLVLILRV